MSQFVMITSADNLELPNGLRLCAIESNEDFFQSIAQSYFGTWGNCRLVFDESGRTEPIIDDVFEAQQFGCGIEEIAFVKLLTQLVKNKTEFICWCGKEYNDLPVVLSWTDLIDQLLKQTAVQPAEFYVHYRVE